jgi:hypothetical protein
MVKSRMMLSFGLIAMLPVRFFGLPVLKLTDTPKLSIGATFFSQPNVKIAAVARVKIVCLKRIIVFVFIG